ncbi:helix-turn-helix domain-containing protein [Actinomyces sp. B33]|uniref:helix-turn-helix domain-containing protein n=1 Tax=Actinomyces sp. B33 TaxID=2942131 RepID=UPI00234198D2|nr:helix-turn-helix domain-containing protein [Actinomyces sp. B33]MDC4233905.1 helix-turn-helix domain-containing protein [Actinomyces sp. B33]
MAVPTIEMRESMTITPEQTQAARRLPDEFIAPGQQTRVRLILETSIGESKELPDELTGLVLRALWTVRNGGRLSLESMPAEVTSTTAAGILGVSRPTLMKWAKEGLIASHKVGTHTRFMAEEVLNFKERRREQQKEAFRQMMSVADDLGDFS